MPPKKKRINRRGRTEQELITIRGLVTASEWDEKGNVIAIAISTFDEDEYLVDSNLEGEELLCLIRKEVEVSGLLKQKNNKKIISVVDHRLGQDEEMPSNQ